MNDIIFIKDYTINKVKYTKGSKIKVGTVLCEHLIESEKVAKIFVPEVKAKKATKKEN